MTFKLVNHTAAPNLVCHFCGQVKSAYGTFTCGLFRLCRECLAKHPIDIVAKGIKGMDQPASDE